MKIFIDFKFTEKPWGGGNQFLKALYHSFKKDGYIEDKIENADIILFNSHHEAKEIFYHKTLKLRVMLVLLILML